jgi:hypothetical protein
MRCIGTLDDSVLRYQLSLALHSPVTEPGSSEIAVWRDSSCQAGPCHAALSSIYNTAGDARSTGGVMATAEELSFLAREHRAAEQRVENLHQQLQDAIRLRDATRVLLEHYGVVGKDEPSTNSTVRVEARTTEPTIAPGEFTGMRIRDAMYLVMQRAGRPMRAIEIVDELQRGGLVMTARVPAQTVTSTLIRETDRYEKVDIGVYRLRAVGETAVQNGLAQHATHVDRVESQGEVGNVTEEGTPAWASHQNRALPGMLPADHQLESPQWTK